MLACIVRGLLVFKSSQIRSFHANSANLQESSMCTVSDFAQNCTKCVTMGAMKNPQVSSDQNSKRFRFYGLFNYKGHNPFLPSWITMLILKRSLEAHNFIVVQAISLKIGSLDISGLLFLNLQSEMSYEVWIKSYKHLKTGFLSGRVHICHILTTRCDVPSWSRSKYSPDL